MVRGRVGGAPAGLAAPGPVAGRAGRVASVGRTGGLPVGGLEETTFFTAPGVAGVLPEAPAGSLAADGSAAEGWVG